MAKKSECGRMHDNQYSLIHYLVAPCRVTKLQWHEVSAMSLVSLHRFFLFRYTIIFFSQFYIFYTLTETMYPVLNSRLNTFTLNPFTYFSIYRSVMLLSLIHILWFASMRWFAKVDSVVVWSAFVCSMYLCLKLRPVCPM